MAINTVGGLISCQIMVEGEVIPGSYSVYSVVIEQAVNRGAIANITLLDGEASSENFAISSSSTFVLGNAVSIHLGYDGNNSLVFSGILTSQRAKAEQQNASKLVIECRDNAVVKLIDPIVKTTSVATYTYGDNIISVDAQLNASTLTGTLRAQGNAIALGNCLSLQGMGARFNGDYLVFGVCHEVEDGNWTTELQLGVPSNWLDQQKKCSA